MYNWLFFKIYDYYRNKDNDDPTLNASGLVFIAQGIHVAALLLIFSKIFHFDIPGFSTEKSINKLFFIPILYLWVTFVNRYYKNKVKNRQFRNNIDPVSLYKLILIVFIIILIPLYFVIRLSGGQIWRFD